MLERGGLEHSIVTIPLRFALIKTRRGVLIVFFVSFKLNSHIYLRCDMGGGELSHTAVKFGSVVESSGCDLSF